MFCLSLFFPSLCSLVLFSKCYICVKSYGVCVSPTGLFHLASYSLAPSRSSPMWRFHTLVRLSDIPLSVCVCLKYIYNHFYRFSFPPSYLGLTLSIGLGKAWGLGLGPGWGYVLCIKRVRDLSIGYWLGLEVNR